MREKSVITCVVGLPGSGKTHYANQECSKTGGIVIDDITSFNQLKSAFVDNEYIYITDPHFCIPQLRYNAEKMISSLGKNIEIKWIYFENSAEKCLKNIKHRKDNRSVEPTIMIYTKIYDPPKDAKKIWQE